MGDDRTGNFEWEYLSHVATKAARRPRPDESVAADNRHNQPPTKPLLATTPNRFSDLPSTTTLTRERRENFHPAENPTIIAAGITPATKEGRK